MLKKYGLTVFSFIVGILISIFCVDNLVDGIILTILLTLAVTMIEQKIKNEQSESSLKNELQKIQDELCDMQQKLLWTEELQKISHPYFKKLMSYRISHFLQQNKEILAGINRTSPHADDTFGVEGISYTKEYGNIKAVSSIDDYWEDDFSVSYLDMQQKLIREKHVTIQRIFILDKNQFSKKEKLLKDQHRRGIQVYYVDKKSPYLDAEWLNDDFLIQDDELLVQINGNSHKVSDDGTGTTEIITMDPDIVQNKIERFLRLLERSTKYK